MASGKHHRGGPGCAPRHARLLIIAYALALVQVVVVFTIGEPYPSLQGPLFAGHLQEGRLIHVPFYHDDSATTRLPSHENLLRHETLAIPAQQNFAKLAPTLSGRPAQEFLIGHSLRSPALRRPHGHDFDHVRWSTWKFHAPLHAPPELLGEEDTLADE